MHTQKYIRNNSVLLSERTNFDKRQPKCLCKWESEVSCWNSSEVDIVVVNQGQCRDTHKATALRICTEQSKRLHIRDYLQTQGIQMCVCVTELLCVYSGGSETYGVNVAISSEAGRRFATISGLCFLFGLDPVIFPFSGCEEATEIKFLW